MLVTFPFQANAYDNTTLIKNAEIFDATGQVPFKSDVLVKNGRIELIEEKIEPSSHVKSIINASGLSMLPGLIDVHTHWTSAENMTRASTATALLQSGVTTVTDFHSSPESYAAKRSHHKSLLSPDVFFIARMSTPGGHGASWGDDNMTRIVASKEEAKRGVGIIAPYKPDAIKVFSDGWRYGGDNNLTSMNEPVLKTIVDEAQAADLPVFTHTVTVDKAYIAARAKVRAIVHALQDENADMGLAKLMRDNEVFYAPTLAVYEPRPDKLVGVSKDRRAIIEKRQKHSKYNLQLFERHGVKIALGSDSGIASTPIGESSLRELELLVDFGLTPTQALIAGTINSAGVLGFQKDRGTLEVGKRADFVLVRGKPWENISDYRKLDSVFVSGRPLVKNGVLNGNQGIARPSVSPALKLIDDFEHSDGKTAAQAERRHLVETGHPRSELLVHTIPRGQSDKALHLSAKMSIKENPSAFVTLPLSPGAYSPRDVSRFEGIRFDARGDGAYELIADTGSTTTRAKFEAGRVWSIVEISFDDLGHESKTQIETLTEISIGGRRQRGDMMWLEIDNVEFF
jgi:imidazolonepropionase-like amidohydrolase